MNPRRQATVATVATVAGAVDRAPSPRDPAGVSHAPLLAESAFALLGATPADWGERAASHLPELLLEQAHLEKKAAAAAQRFLFRVPDEAWMHRALSRLAREELVHFERTLQWLARRRIEYRRQVPGGYAEALKQNCRQDVAGRLVDELLTGGLIEARSHERMDRLAAALGSRDAEIAAFYADLVQAEARHHLVYVEIAAALTSVEAVQQRWHELAAHEAAWLASAPFVARLHGGHGDG